MVSVVDFSVVTYSSVLVCVDVSSRTSDVGAGVMLLVSVGISVLEQADNEKN